MTINRALIQEIEKNRRKFIPEDLKKYLLATYSYEPFPNEFSEQGLYNSVYKDIDNYESGKLDLTPKSPSERRKEVLEELRDLYYEKCHEVRDLSEYVDELERILTKNHIETDRMKENRIALLSL